MSTVAGSKVITSASGKFSPNDVGQPIAQTGNTNIPACSLVTSVLSTSKAVISAPSPATASAVTATIGGAAAHSVATALLTTAGSPTVSLTSGAFTGADVGRVFNGTPGVANGTTIVSVAPGGSSATLSAAATAGTQATLIDVSVAPGSTTLTGASITAADQNDVIGANPLGIPAGTTITAAAAGTATLSAAATGGGGPAPVTVNRPVSASLYAAAPVPNGSYQLTVVSDGAPSAALTDPGYTQSDVSSGSVFTVAPF